MEARWKIPLMLDLPFRTRAVKGHPYLEYARASLGSHWLEACTVEEVGRNTLRILVDGTLIYGSGDAMPTAAWFDLCREGGYRPRFDWDRDPVTILFHGVLPAMAKKWTSFPLPYRDDGFPDGVVGLPSLQEAHAAFTRRASDAHSSPNATQAAQVAEMLASLPLRAVVLHDRPEQRVDYLGNAIDEAYVGIDLILGNKLATPARLTKVSLPSPGGLHWSPWLAGGRWDNVGGTFLAKGKAADFLKASGLLVEPLAGFDEAFDTQIKHYSAFMDEALAGYLANHPAAIAWHPSLGIQRPRGFETKAGLPPGGTPWIDEVGAVPDPAGTAPLNELHSELRSPP